MGSRVWSSPWHPHVWSNPSSLDTQWYPVTCRDMWWPSDSFHNIPTAPACELHMLEDGSISEGIPCLHPWHVVLGKRETLVMGGSKKGCRKVMSIYFPWFWWSLTFSVFGDHYLWQPWHLCSGVSVAKQRLRIQWRCCWHRRQHRQTRCQKHRSRRRPADSKSKCQNMSRHIPKQSKNMGGLRFLFRRQQLASGMPHPEMMVDDIAPALSFWCITTTIKCFMFPYVPTLAA